MSAEQDAVEMMREFARRALRHVLYHERGLRHGHRKLAAISGILARGGFTELNIDQIRQEVFGTDDDDYDENEQISDVVRMMRQIARSVLRTINYHETELSKAHAEIAAAKIMMERGKYREFTLDELKNEAEQRDLEIESETPDRWCDI